MASITTETVWLVIVAGALGTFGLRVSFIAIFGRIDSVPPRVDLLLRYVPAAVLAALVVPPLLAPAGDLSLSLGNDRLLAGSLAAVVAWRTENMLATIGVGMGALWTLTWLL